MRKQVASRLGSADGRRSGVAYFWRLAAGCIAAGVIVAVAVGLWREHILPDSNEGTPRPPSEVEHIAPLESEEVADTEILRVENVWSGITDEGTVLVNDEIPMRQLRRQFLRHVQLIDPARNVSVEMTLPEEEVIYVELATY